MSVNLYIDGLPYCRYSMDPEVRCNLLRQAREENIKLGSCYYTSFQEANLVASWLQSKGFDAYVRDDVNCHELCERDYHDDDDMPPQEWYGRRWFP